MTGICLKL